MTAEKANAAEGILPSVTGEMSAGVLHAYLELFTEAPAVFAQRLGGDGSGGHTGRTGAPIRGRPPADARYRRSLPRGVGRDPHRAASGRRATSRAPSSASTAGLSAAVRLPDRSAS